MKPSKILSSVGFGLSLLPLVATSALAQGVASHEYVLDKGSLVYRFNRRSLQWGCQNTANGSTVCSNVDPSTTVAPGLAVVAGMHLDGASVGVDFTGLSRDSSKLVGNMAYEGVSGLRSGKSRIVMRFESVLQSCDGETVADREALGSDDLKTLIGKLRGFEFKDYLSCSFAITKTANSEGGSTAAQAGRFVVQGDGMLLFSWDLDGGPVEQTYLPRNTNDTPQGALAAQDAQRLIGAIQDYGNILLLNQGSARPRATRYAAVTAWIAKNKGAIIQSLTAIGRGFPRASFIQKLTIHRNVLSALDMAQAIEERTQFDPTESLFDVEVKNYLSPIYNLASPTGEAGPVNE